LKAFTILVIAGLIFGFYFLERKKIQYQKDIPRRTFQWIGWVITAIVVLAIVLGFVVGGSPSTARKQGFDIQRANDLRTIAGCVANFGGNQKRLPDTLQELSQNGQYSYCLGELSDPETGVAYGYRVVTSSMVSGGVREGEFELCANFTTDSQGTGTGKSSYNSPNDKWVQRGMGRNCDMETANLERYLDSPAPNAMSGSGSTPVPPIAVPVKKL
jgi:hypothetical protein